MRRLWAYHAERFGGPRPSSHWWSSPRQLAWPMDAATTTLGVEPVWENATVAFLPSEASTATMEEATMKGKTKHSSRRTRTLLDEAGMQQVHLNAAGIDIGSEQHWVAVP